MNIKKVLGWTLGVLLLLAIIVAVATPNLLRSRPAAEEAARYGRLRTFTANKSDVAAPESAQLKRAQSERKLIHRVALELVVTHVDAAATDLRRIAATYRGAVDRVQLNDVGDNLSGELELRIPSDQLEAALAEFKKIAVKVGHEEVSAKDVTRESADNEARLRNLKAEEQQYLEIMKRAGTIKETLDVAEKLSDVRGRIESLQAEINVLQHDVEMSAIAIMLVHQPTTPGLLADWHPLLNARGAIASLLTGLSAWADFMISALILLPAILLWTGTVAAAFFAVYWILKLLSRRFGRSVPVSATRT